jgi:hypothetical protein
MKNVEAAIAEALERDAAEKEAAEKLEDYERRIKSLEARVFRLEKRK